MKYKKIIIALLFISIFLNVVQFYKNKRYKEVFREGINNYLTDIFATSGGLEQMMLNIVDSGQTTNSQLQEIKEMYNKLIINIQYLGFMANEYSRRNEKYWNIQFYSDVFRDLSELASQVEAKDSNTIIKLSGSDIAWIEKLKRHINDINGIGKKYSYLEDDVGSYSLDTWIVIYRELSGFSYYNNFQSP